jgi:hypothetical protein
MYPFLPEHLYNMYRSKYLHLHEMHLHPSDIQMGIPDGKIPKTSIKPCLAVSNIEPFAKPRAVGADCHCHCDHQLINKAKELERSTFRGESSDSSS